MVYRVDLELVEVMLRNGGDNFIRSIGEHCRDELQQLAEWFEAEIDEGAPTPAQAVATLVRGEPASGHGFMYAYAFELIVSRIGAALDNSAFYPCDTELLEDVDAALAELGVPDELTTEGLQDGELPIELPRPDDFPGFGHWPASLVAKAHAKLDGAALPDSLDDAVSEGIAAVQRWLKEAAQRNEAIVGFYY